MLDSDAVCRARDACLGDGELSCVGRQNTTSSKCKSPYFSHGTPYLQSKNMRPMPICGPLIREKEPHSEHKR